MITVIVTHEVKDFAEWKNKFESDSTNRDNAGLKLNGVYTSVDNPNEVTISMDAPSAEVIKGMMGNADFQQTMKDAGVISAPQIKMLNKA